MPDKLKSLKYQATETAQGLAEKVRRFEQGLKQQATETRALAEQYLREGGSPWSTATGVLKFQVREHPFPSVGAAAILGFVTTFWFDKTWGPILNQVVKEFEPELKKVRTAAFMLITKAASSQLKDAYPVMTDKLSKILEEKLPNSVPDDAISQSEELRREHPRKGENAKPLADKYSGERVSPDTPSHAEAKKKIVDDTVMPG